VSKSAIDIFLKETVFLFDIQQAFSLASKIDTTLLVGAGLRVTCYMWYLLRDRISYDCYARIRE
jgi:hypothetical protein